MRSWKMWAGDLGDRFMYFGDRRYVELYDPPGGKIVEVEVSEDPEGSYYGWLDTPGRWPFPNKDSEIPCMIQPNKIFFDMCFEYKPEKLVQAGQGEIIRLNVKALGER